MISNNTTNNLFIVKFDKINSNYDLFIYNLNIKIINLTDEKIIEFYEINTLPTLIIYRNNTIIDILEGYYNKTKLLSIISNYNY